ncbi:MAG: sigma-70 family RNA polymerase sigma factor [Gemmatimonadetes bacterium]|nr:sigma-70 family RNA polymerase sigma factor [Gemmatimonadota bacterium]
MALLALSVSPETPVAYTMGSHTAWGSHLRRAPARTPPLRAPPNARCAPGGGCRPGRLPRLWRETRPVDNPRSWLFRVCTNLVRDQSRRTAIRERHAAQPDDAQAESPEEEFARAESVRTVRLALDRLIPRDREALLLRESGFRYAEIADVIDVRVAIVPTLIARALKRFHKAYLEETSDATS